MAVVWTIEERCKRCYSCIRECPAKAIKVEHGQAKVIEERCIGCGHCVQVCSQNAKAILNSVDSTFELLNSSEKVVAMLAPSFPAMFPDMDYVYLVGALRQCGFDKVVEVAFGADLINQEYEALVEQIDKQRAQKVRKPIITSSCPAICKYIEKYVPELLPNLAPIVSPMVAMGRVVHDYYGKDAKVIFIGPCTAKKLEIRDEAVQDSVDEVLTFDELIALWKKCKVEPEQAIPSCFDPPNANMGRLYPVSGGLLKSAGLPHDILDNGVIITEGKNRVLKLLDCLQTNQISANLVDVLFCEGCISGPFTNQSINYFTRKQKVVAYADKKRLRSDLTEWKQSIERFRDINVKRTFELEQIFSALPSEEDLKKILAKIDKFSPSDELNCGACGYETCREYATAVHQGLAEDDMCLPYLIEKLQKTRNELQFSLVKLEKTQEQLIQHEKLASIGQLAAGVAHEVNNPLGSIMLFAHLVLQNLSKDDASAKDLKFIIEEANRCQKIVSGLVNFSRQGNLNLKPHSVNELLERVIQAVKNQPNFRNINILLNISPDIPEIHVDSEQIYQVFLNIIVNAADAMPQGGQLLISCGVDWDNQRVTISFKDSGIGIPEENIKKLFTPFFTTKQIGKGTGLGLAIAYGILKMHKGNIHVESEVGQYTCFTIELPIFAEAHLPKTENSEIKLV